MNINDFIIIGSNYGSLIGSVLLSISSSNAIHSILNLINTFFAGTLFIVILKLIFFALIFLAVYLGAIVVLFLFIIMMLDLKTTNQTQLVTKSWAFNDLFLLTILIVLYNVNQTKISSSLKNIIQDLDYSANWKIFDNNTLFTFDTDYVYYFDLIQTHTQLSVVGRHMFEHFIFVFLYCGILLFIAMVGAIVLTVESLKKKFLYQQEAGLQSMRNTSVVPYTLQFNKQIK